MINQILKQKITLMYIYITFKILRIPWIFKYKEMLIKYLNQKLTNKVVNNLKYLNYSKINSIKK